MTIPPDFPWRPGMRILDDTDEHGAAIPALRVTYVGGIRWQPTGTIGQAYAEGPDDEGPYVFDGNSVPDPNDPATLGALLGAVREAYGDHKAYVMFSRTIGAWVFSAFTRDPIESYVSELSALLAAWNARPKATP